MTDRVPARCRERRLLAISAGGGGDSLPVLRLGVALLERTPSWRGALVAGPYADRREVARLRRRAKTRGRVSFVANAPECAGLFARAGAVLQMAGYNSTFEALAAGHRPILVPRRAPRAEQAIRARRLQALGLADVIDANVEVESLSAVLETDRSVGVGTLQAAGIDLSGAERAADVLGELAARRSR